MVKRKLFYTNSIILAIFLTVFFIGIIKNYGNYSLRNSNYLQFKNLIIRQKYDINCRAIIELDFDEINRAKTLLNSLNNMPKLLSDENFIFEKSYCKLYETLREYNQFDTYTTQMEKNFPLAYIILTYNNVEQFERLLRSIYRSHNIYCIHVDKKSSEKFKQAVESIVNCFDNVFITSKLERIVYAGFTRLKADLNCMNDLVNLRTNKTNTILNKRIKYVDWKYLINMASSEFPLRTNYELVKILKMYNGSNEIEILKYTPYSRIKKIWKEDSNGELQETGQKMPSAPHNYTIMKGLAYCVFSRNFIEYVLTNKYALDLINWSNGTFSPDEIIWATIQYNTQFDPPGGFIDKTPKDSRINTISRFAGWGGEYNCKGKYRNGVCILSIEDLPELATRPHFFVNKFLLDYDPISYQCMEEWYELQSKRKQTLINNMYFYCQFIIKHSKLANCPSFV